MLSRQPKRRIKPRQGALLSAEMLITFPVLMVMLFGLVETSLLISAYNQLKHASSVGARVCSISPGDSSAKVAMAIREALNNDDDLIQAATVTLEDSGVSGSFCRVTIELPMSDAAPNLLEAFGFKLDGTLKATTAMLKE